MFGLNDNNQNDNAARQHAPHADGSAPALPADDNFADPSGGAPLPHSAPPSFNAPTLGDQHAEPVSQDALIGLKEEALNNLSPLIGHLEQSPEDKFKTLMMLIQASDNSSLIKQAYEAANQIHDEKARAQALLDVVNEINYFTQKDQSETV